MSPCWDPPLFSLLLITTTLLPPAAAGDPDVDFIEYRFVQDAKCSEFEDLFIKMFLQEESGEDRGLFPPLSVSRLHKDVGTIDSPQAPNL